MATANTAAVARAKRASLAGRKSILAVPRVSEAQASSVEPVAVYSTGTEEALTRVSTTTKNTAAVARARRSTLVGRQGVGSLSVDDRRSVQMAQRPDESSQAIINPLQMVRRLSQQIVEAANEALGKMAQHSESV